MKDKLNFLYVHKNNFLLIEKLYVNDLQIDICQKKKLKKLNFL